MLGRNLVQLKDNANFDQDLGNIVEDLLTLSMNSTLDSLVERNNREISKIVDKYAPVKSKRVTRRERRSWYDGELCNLTKTARRAERQWKTTRTDRDKHVHSELLT